MKFHSYTNWVSQASRNLAMGIFILGLSFIGIGFLIYVLRDIFAILFAALFAAIGSGCAVTAVRIFWHARKFGKTNSMDSANYRRNVRIHSDEHYDTRRTV